MPETTEPTPKTPKAKKTSTRAPRHNYAAEHARLTQYCRISVNVMEALVAAQAPGNDMTQNFMQGQITALKAVLCELGETEGV